MTLKGLIMKVDLDSLLPYLEKREKKNLNNIYAFREAYDILRNMEPDEDYKGEVTVITMTREDGTKITQVNFLDDNVWEKELLKNLFFPTAYSSVWKNLPCAVCGKSLSMVSHPQILKTHSPRCSADGSR